MTDAEARAYKGNPIDNLEPLAKAKIPIFCVCGDLHDWVVPIEANTLLLESRYKELGGDVTVIRKPGAGHRPHSLPNPTPIVNFVLKHTTGGQVDETKLAAEEARKAELAAQSIDTIPLASKPDATMQLQAFDGPRGMANFFGARIRGFVYPPRTGEYVFGIAGDDVTRLYLSTDEDPAKKELIASALEPTAVANFTKFPTQKSRPIRLEEGKKYYIEALHKENAANDHVSVGWAPVGGGEPAIISGDEMSPYPTGDRGTIVHEAWLHQETWPERNK